MSRTLEIIFKFRNNKTRILGTFQTKNYDFFDDGDIEYLKERVINEVADIEHKFKSVRIRVYHGCVAETTYFYTSDLLERTLFDLKYLNSVSIKRSSNFYENMIIGYSCKITGDLNFYFNRDSLTLVETLLKKHDVQYRILDNAKNKSYLRILKNCSNEIVITRGDI